MKATTTTEDTTDKFCIKMLHSLLPCHSYAYTFLLTVHDQNLISINKILIEAVI